MKEALKEAFAIYSVYAETCDGTVELMVPLGEAIKCVDDILAWMPYPECKPVISDYYLVTLDNGEFEPTVEIAYWDFERFWTENTVLSTRISAFMPMPEPFDEETKTKGEKHNG